MSDSLRDKAVGSIGWIALDKWGARLSNLAVLLILGRLVAPEAFGLIAIATAILAFVGVFVDQGLSKALIQKETLAEKDSPTAFWTSLAISVVLAAISAAAAPLIASVTGEPQLTPVLQVLSISLVLTALGSTPAALLEREFKFKELALRRLTGTVVGSVAAVAVAIAGGGVWALVAQSVAGAAASLIALWLMSDWKLKFAYDFRALRELWRVGGAVLGTELIGLVNSQSDRLIIGIYFSAEALGYYYMAMRVISILIELFTSVLSSVTLTSFSRLQSDPTRLRSWLYRLVSLSSAAAIPIFAATAIAAPAVIPLILGSRWAPASPFLQILCLLGAINAVAYFDRNLLLSIGRAKDALLLSLGQAVFGLALLFAMAPLGVLWVAIAVVVRQYAYWPVRLIVLRRAAGVSPRRYLAQWIKPALIAGGFTAIAFAVAAVVPFSDFELAVFQLAAAAITAICCFSLIRFYDRESYAVVTDLLKKRRKPRAA